MTLLDKINDLKEEVEGLKEKGGLALHYEDGVYMSFKKITEVLLDFGINPELRNKDDK